MLGGSTGAAPADPPSATRRAASGPAGPVRDVTPAASAFAAPAAPAPIAAPGAPERFRVAPTCRSGVAAVGPDGTTRCVPATPAASAEVNRRAHPSGGATLFDVFGLPFTGVDAAAAVALGALALAFGLALRRRRARPGGA
ncbi:MAG TPA: hypothetical protein VFW74_05665 [Acidimicrobiia bacterium]|nr:hypothetical protein [Acidimicrobiia bacterium]